MSEIRLDNDLAIGSFIDGQDVIEVWIDGCVIAFAKLLRSGWKTVTGGGGSFNVDLSDANFIIQAGIRYRGMSATSSTVSRSTGWSAICVTSGSSPCSGSTSVITNPGTAPFGCEYGSMSHVVAWTMAAIHTQYSSMPQFMIWAAGYGPSSVSPHSSPQLSPRNSVSHSGASSSADANGNYDRFGIAGRAVSYFPRVCYSAMNDRAVEFPGGWEGKYTFWLSSGSLAPSSSGVGNTKIDHSEGNDDWFYNIPFPNSALIAGQTNTINLTQIDGSNRTQVELFVVYR